MDGVNGASIRGIDLARDTYGDVAGNNFMQILNLGKALERGEDVARQYLHLLRGYKIAPACMGSHDPLTVYTELLKHVYDFEPPAVVTEQLMRRQRSHRAGSHLVYVTGGAGK